MEKTVSSKAHMHLRVLLLTAENNGRDLCFVFKGENENKGLTVRVKLSDVCNPQFYSQDYLERNFEVIFPTGLSSSCCEVFRMLVLRALRESKSLEVRIVMALGGEKHLENMPQYVLGTDIPLSLDESLTFYRACNKFSGQGLVF